MQNEDVSENSSGSLWNAVPAMELLHVGIIPLRLLCDLQEMDLAPTSNDCTGCSLRSIKPYWYSFGSPWAPQRQYVHDELFSDSTASLFPAVLMNSYKQPGESLHCSLSPLCSWDDEALDT